MSTKDLRQAALEVFWAFNREFVWLEDGVPGPNNKALAAAVRAVADYVVPWQEEPNEESISPTIDFGYAWALFSKANDIRQEILQLADTMETFYDAN